MNQFFAALFLLLSVGAAQAQSQGTISAKSPAVRVNTLPFFEAKAAVRTTVPETVRGRTVWRETFADNQQGWKTGKVGNGTLILTPGTYKIQTNNRNVSAVSLINSPVDLNGSDFTFEATIESTGDSSPNVGISVGGEADKYYVLQINYLSKFIVQYVMADKEPFTADDFVFNTNIMKNTNKLRIAKTGGTIDFYINNEKIQTRLFQPLSSQQIGLIGAGNNAGFKSILLIGMQK